MPLIPSGFADVSIQIESSATVRKSYITFGISSGTPTNPNQTASNVKTATEATGSLLSGFDNSVVLREYKVTVGQESGEPLIGVAAGAALGTKSGTMLPPNCAGLVNKLTARGGRRGRGRLFLPWFIDEGSVDEAGIITSPLVTSTNVILSKWLLELGNQLVPMHLLHSDSAEGVENPTAPGTPTLVTGLTLQSMIGSQRRRLGRK